VPLLPCRCDPFERGEKPKAPLEHDYQAMASEALFEIWGQVWTILTRRLKDTGDF
jgi:hypothetical protein